MTFECPDDLLKLQQDLNTVRSDLDTLIRSLPYSTEPADAWQRPDGYWLSTSPSFPDSPGWEEEEQEQVVMLREKERDLAAKIVTHRFWSEVTGPQRPDARSQLKHALGAEHGENQETEAA
ncbi:nucleic acid-binding protein [Streptomyces hyaluromycini]|uniref:nucleic acid-binding protein n=1 Tax=Streptomyces hyaluromycini TaxID=1377993 RepID=UPI000B5C6230|nr:nucleic acid-binding protein [Streptomyces hyaluromycini]